MRAEDDAPAFCQVWATLLATLSPGLRQGGTALEVGCGAGLGCLALAEAFPALTVTGHDVDPEAIARARRLARAARLHHRVRFQVDDSRRLAHSTLDLILAAGALHRPDAPRLLNTIRNALVPDGVCLVVAPRTASPRRFSALAWRAGFSRCGLIHRNDRLLALRR